MVHIPDHHLLLLDHLQGHLLLVLLLLPKLLL
jgi:hypothetical protein